MHPIMGTALWTALLTAALLAGDANATTASEVEQLIREATATLDEASATGGEWRNSRKLPILKTGAVGATRDAGTVAFGAVASMPAMSTRLC